MLTDTMDIDRLYQIFKRHSVVSTDSRNCADGAIFFALKGDNFDGNAFAASAIENGASYAVVDDPHVALDERFILQNNVLDTLTQLASHHRNVMPAEIIGITGTNGKTTTKELIFAVLSTTYNVLATTGNLNNHIGVPLTLLRINEMHQYAIIEMGANHMGEIAHLCDIAQPDFGLITNIGKAHLEGFGSFENIVTTKSELYNYLRHNDGKVFVNEKDELLLSLCADLDPIPYISKKNGLLKIKKTSPFLTLKWDIKHRKRSIKTHLTGDYNAINIMAGIAIGRHFGVTPGNIVRAIENYIPTNNRSQMVKTRDNVLYVDAYNANPTSMSASINSFVKSEGKEKLIILGDMKELGDFSIPEHGEIIRLIENCGIKTFFIGEEFHKAMGDKKLESFVDMASFIEYLNNNRLVGKTILLKGSRGMKVEQLIAFL